MNLRDAAAQAANGLSTEPQKILDMMLRDYDPYLSLRRIPEGDPAFKAGQAFDPPRIFGVWEETSAATTKWVFTIPEISILNPGEILARIVVGDSSKRTPKERMEILQASQQAAVQAKEKFWEDVRAQRREEMNFIASNGKSRITHTIDGEKMILGDTMRRARTHI